MVLPCRQLSATVQRFLPGWVGPKKRGNNASRGKFGIDATPNTRKESKISTNDRVNKSKDRIKTDKWKNKFCQKLNTSRKANVFCKECC